MLIINIYTIFGIAIALSVDAFAVAVATGVTLKNVNFRQTFRLSWHFGLFQALMPILGWFLGNSINSYIEQIDHWVAFAFLSFVGVKMISESKNHESDKKKISDPTKGGSLVILSIATSIDAFAVGLSLAILKVSIFYPAIIIGVITLTLTAIGLHIGRWIRSASKVGNYAEFAGGIILIAIGLNILREHLF